MRFASFVSLIALAISGTAAGGPVAGTVPNVSIVSAAGLACPNAGAMRRALGEAGVPVARADAPGWTLQLKKAGGALRMSLLDPVGSVVLERALAISSSSCKDASRAIAIVVDRYFRDLVTTADVPSASQAAGPPESEAPPPGTIRTPSPAPTAATASTPSPAPTAATASTPTPAPTASTTGTPSPAPTTATAGTTAPAPTTATTGTTAPAPTTSTAGTTAPAPTTSTAGTTAPAPTATRRTIASAISTPAAPSHSRLFSPPARLAVGMGAALWTRSTTAAVLLDARVRLSGPVCVGAGVLLPSFGADEQLSVGGGSVRVSGVPLVVHLAVAGLRGRWGGSMGLESLMTFEQGVSQGIAGSATVRRSVLGVGLGVGGSVALGSGLRIAADLAGYRSVLGRSFVVDGLTDPVLEPPVWQAIVGARLEWTPWR